MQEIQQCFKIIREDESILIVCPNEDIKTLKPKILEMAELFKREDIFTRVSLVNQTEF